MYAKNEMWQMLKFFLQNNCLLVIYIQYMYKQGLALNNLQGLICNETQTIESKQTKASLKIVKRKPPRRQRLAYYSYTNK